MILTADSSKNNNQPAKRTTHTKDEGLEGDSNTFKFVGDMVLMLAILLR